MSGNRPETDGPFDRRILARLAGASALWVEMRTLAEQDLGTITPEEARRLVIEQNVLAKATRANRMEVAKKLVQRYILDAANPAFRAFWQQYQRESSEAQRGLLGYLLLSASDFLVRRTGVEWLGPKLNADGSPLTYENLAAYWDDLAAEHDELTEWSETTRERMMQHYLGAIRDFGLAEGKYTKRVVRPHVGPAPVMLAARYSVLEGLSPRETLEADWFRLFGLTVSDVIAKLYELNGLGRARFRVAGDVVELSLTEGSNGQDDRGPRTEA